jgi:hypothetical protein
VNRSGLGRDVREADDWAWYDVFVAVVRRCALVPLISSLCYFAAAPLCVASGDANCERSPDAAEKKKKDLVEDPVSDSI